MKGSVSRMKAYAKQRGHAELDTTRLTPKQRRRVAKKSRVYDKRRFIRAIKKAESDKSDTQ